MSQISVIVPVYNVENYLIQCVNSILSQTFTDFELLLVDDGSKDNSGMICDEFAEKDTRVKVFHTENRGVSAARNLGIKKAVADWICFIDSDDWVDDNYLKSLYCDRNLCDKCIVCQSFYVEYELLPEKRYKSRLYHDAILKEPFDEQMVMDNILNDYCVNIFAKLFRKEVIKDNGIYFNEKTSIFEDAIFLHKYLLYIKEFYFSSSVSYHYMRWNNNLSLTIKKHSCEEWFATAVELLKTNELLIKKFSICDEDNLREIYNHYGLSQLYTACICVNKNNYNKVFDYVKNKKELFQKYYETKTIEQKIFKYIFFINKFSCKMIYFLINLYKTVMIKH